MEMPEKEKRLFMKKGKKTSSASIGSGKGRKGRMGEKKGSGLYLKTNFQWKRKGD